MIMDGFSLLRGKVNSLLYKPIVRVDKGRKEGRATCCQQEQLEIKVLAFFLLR